MGVLSTISTNTALKSCYRVYNCHIRQEVPCLLPLQPNYVDRVHNSPLQVRRLHTTSTHSISLCSVLVLPCHQLLDVTSRHFSAGLPTINITPCGILMFGPPQCSVMATLYYAFRPPCCDCLPLKPRYSLHEPVLEHNMNAHPCRNVRQDGRTLCRAVHCSGILVDTVGEHSGSRAI